MRKIVVALACMVLFGVPMRVVAQATLDQYEKGEYVASNGEKLLYRMLSPEKIEKGKKYPIVLFLHGAGERGSDNAKQLVHGAQMWLNPVNRANYPAFVIFPQCPESGYWSYVHRPADRDPQNMPCQEDIAPISKAVLELLESVIAREDTDPRRVYVMGLSMGAMATYDLTLRRPDLFAAAIPICGSVNPTRYEGIDLRKTHFRIFHGDADDVVPVEGSREAYRALVAHGVKVYYTEYPGVFHNSWDSAFNEKDFMGWLFGNVR